MRITDELRLARNAAEEELGTARKQLSVAQSCFAKAKKKYERARDAWVAEMEKAQ
jgi:hypothetical protein